MRKGVRKGGLDRGWPIELRRETGEKDADGA